MPTIDLPGLRVRLSEPRPIVRGVGHVWFPVIDRFASGELIAQWSMMPDIHCFAYVAGASHSTDNGKTWSRPYSYGNFANQCLPLPDGSLRRIPYYVYPAPPGQRRQFTTDLSTVWPGGRNETIPHGASISFPRDVEVMATGAAAMNFTGRPVFSRGRWLTTVYGCWNDDPRPKDRHNFHLHVVETHDLGRTWQFVSTIAGHNDRPAPTPEGPCEACLCELEGGQLLCVYRVGSFEFYRASRSDNGGRTWTRAEILDGPYSVEPSLLRLAGGVLALSGGRPDLRMWLANDKAGKAWHAIDLMAHHNACTPPGEQLVSSRDKPLSTHYTELVEIAPNRAIVVYDRCPLSWSPVPLESPERATIYMMEIEVEQ